MDDLSLQARLALRIALPIALAAGILLAAGTPTAGADTLTGDEGTVTSQESDQSQEPSAGDTITETEATMAPEADEAAAPGDAEPAAASETPESSDAGGVATEPAPAVLDPEAGAGDGTDLPELASPTTDATETPASGGEPAPSAPEDGTIADGEQPVVPGCAPSPAVTPVEMGPVAPDESEQPEPGTASEQPDTPLIEPVATDSALQEFGKWVAAPPDDEQPLAHGTRARDDNLRPGGQVTVGPSAAASPPTPVADTRTTIPQEPEPATPTSGVLILPLDAASGELALGASPIAAMVVPRASQAVAVAVEFGRTGGGWAGTIVFNIWLRRQLRERRMTQRQLAALSGVDHSTISRLLSHGRSPSLTTATKLAHTLRVSATDDEIANYFDLLADRTPFPTQRVEAALRGDEQLDEDDVRALMHAYLHARSRGRRDRGNHAPSGANGRDRAAGRD